MNSERGYRLDRRQFLLIAASCSAALLIGERGLSAIARPLHSHSFAALQELPVGAVRPEGWLRTTLEAQAKGLGSQLPRISWPFSEPYWEGETQGESWWPWEQVAYWIDGAARLALVLDDKDLMREVRERIDYTLTHIDSDGYIGPDFFKEPTDDFHRWPHSLFFRGLAAITDTNQGNTENIVSEMTRHFLEDKAPYGKPIRNVMNVEAMLWCYGHNHDERLLALAEKAWSDYLTVASDPEHGDLSKDRVEANTPINAHGVTYMETAKQPAILYVHTGKPEYLQFALAAQKRVFDHHMLIDGIPSTSEWYRTTTSLDSHETCDISDHTWSWGYLLMASGDGVWGDRIERGVFNAGMGAIKKDWKALQYFSCPNQFIATLNSDHNAMAYGGRMMAYQPNPGQRTACCGGNVHRLLPNYVSRMWMRSADGGLAATLYGPSQVTTLVGGQSEPVTITQTTDYPFNQVIHFKIDINKPTEFPLQLRVPEWCERPRIEFNGHHIDLPKPENGFVTIHREFRKGDTLSMNLPMATKTSRWPETGIGLEHGPLVYSLPIKEEWTPVVEAKYTTAEFPSWNAIPSSPWNYGLIATERVKFERKAMTSDPWSNPPTALHVQAKNIPGWELKASDHNAAQKFTPPLPEVSKRETGHQVETLRLVPLGATHLRVTVFPELPKT